jgi:hypothetical protein
VLQQNPSISGTGQTAVEQALADAKAALQGDSPAPDAVSSTLSALVKATNQLASAAKTPATASTGRKEMQQLSGILQQAVTAIQQQD